MASDRQIEANRENARRSTGPRTPLGKARASLNAVRHGLFARNLVLPEEDQEAYLELHASLENRYPPEGPVETFLVQQMASAQWRLQRLERISTGFVIAGREDLKREDDRFFQRPPRPSKLSEDDEAKRLLGIVFQKGCGCDSFALLTRYENMLNTEYFRAFRNLTSLRNARLKTNPIPEPQPEAPPAANRQRQSRPAAPPAPNRDRQGAEPRQDPQRNEPDSPIATGRPDSTEPGPSASGACPPPPDPREIPPTRGTIGTRI